MPTIRRCCIVGCISNSRQNPTLQFFQFPKPENPFHKLWKGACHASLSRILPFKKPVVCALHFHPTCIGGRRLTSSAVPSLLLDVPSDLKAVEQQAMVDEIERSRKCAYINAVVYEWLVRANLNPQLRGSITHGMIKEKAESAKQLIGSTIFVADNRWLNRFRETHLIGFAQKLASSQLKPLGQSLWIPDIVQDLQHLFPPTSAERVANFENVPEQYIGYMQQYGEYEEDDDQDSKDSLVQQSYQEQQQQSHYQQQQHQHPAIHGHGVFDPYAQQQNFNYDPYYFDRQHHHHQLQEQQHQQDSYSSPQQRPASHSPTDSQTPSQPSSNRASPYPIKRAKLQQDDEDTNGTRSEQVEDLTDGPEDSKYNGENSDSAKQVTTNGNAVPKSPKAKPQQTTNGHTSPAICSKELATYAQALEYLKPLEDFALCKENFRAIGLLSQLEVILRKGDRNVKSDKLIE